MARLDSLRQLIDQRMCDLNKEIEALHYENEQLRIELKKAYDTVHTINKNLNENYENTNQ
jgi:septal ring factor EnvC (AmiA/AmiB activator)